MDSAEDFSHRRDLEIYWFNKSSDLRGSAAALWMSKKDEISAAIVEECQLGEGFHLSAAVPSTYRMLAGMSLELLYKAILVAKGQEVPHTHDLERLATTSGVRCVEGDSELLEILSGAIIWAGRYPVPKTSQAYEKLNDLVAARLFEQNREHSRFTVLTPNHALNWSGFDRLWRDGSILFWQHYTPR